MSNLGDIDTPRPFAVTRILSALALLIERDPALSRAAEVLADALELAASRCALLDGHAGLHRSGDELHEGAPSRPAPVGKAPGQVERSIKLEIALDPGSNTSPDDLRRIFVDAFDQAQTNLRAPKVPGFYTPIPGVEMAALRAELAALGKHVEDVERRAYASPTNDALTVELGHNINAPPGQIITTGERLDSLERRVSDNTDALALWQGAVDRLAAKVDALHARIAKLEEREQEALERRVAALVVDPPHMRLRRPLSASSDAPVAEPLDLATLRVPTSETDGTVVLIAEDGRLVITDDVGNNVGVAQLPPTSARLLARMLMQSADAEEAKGASPQAYEPDSEDGS